MMRDISILGAGGFGREVAQLISEINTIEHTWNIRGFFDDRYQSDRVINGVPILGGTDDALKSDCRNFVLAIGNPSHLRYLSTQLQSAGKIFPNLVHPHASLGDPTINLVGIGNIFTFGVYMTTNIVIGNFNIFNTRVTLGHDVRVGSFNVFLSNVQIAGHVTLGDGNLLGMNSSVLQNRKIGSSNRVGAHSFVVSNLADGQSVFGVPAVNF